MSVVRCDVCWRGQVRFLTACMIARRVRALVSVQRRFINSLSACCKCLGPKRSGVVNRCTSDSSTRDSVGFGLGCGFMPSVVDAVLEVCHLLVGVPVSNGTQGTLHAGIVNEVQAIDVGGVHPTKSVNSSQQYIQNAQQNVKRLTLQWRHP